MRIIMAAITVLVVSDPVKALPIIIFLLMWKLIDVCEDIK